MAICSIFTYASPLTITKEKKMLAGQIAAAGILFYIVLMLVDFFFRITAWVSLPFHCIFFFAFLVGGFHFKKERK